MISENDFDKAAKKFIEPAKPKETARSRQRAADNAGITVRPIREEEWQDFKRCVLKLGREDDADPNTMKLVAAWTKAAVVQEMAESHDGLLGVFDGDKFRGTAMIVPLGDAATAYFCNTWIDARLRGRGVVDKIGDALINWARDNKNIEWIYMNHREGNVSSHAMANRIGFTPMTLDTEDSMIWEKKLKHYRMQVRR